MEENLLRNDMRRRKYELKKEIRNIMDRIAAGRWQRWDNVLKPTEE